jgi:O-antigen/teichoic acid export membrane protein
MKWFIDPSYHRAIQVIPWVAFGYAFHGMYMLVFPYLIHTEKTGFIGLLTGVCAVFNLGANYLLIRWHGILGAAEASGLSFLAMFIGLWWYSHRVHPMPWLHALRKSSIPLSPETA